MKNTDLERARLIIAHENAEDRGCVDRPADVLFAAEVFRDAYDTLKAQTRKQATAIEEIVNKILFEPGVVDHLCDDCRAAEDQVRPPVALPATCGECEHYGAKGATAAQCTKDSKKRNVYRISLPLSWCPLRDTKDR